MSRGSLLVCFLGRPGPFQLGFQPSGGGVGGLHDVSMSSMLPCKVELVEGRICANSHARVRSMNKNSYVY